MRTQQRFNLVLMAYRYKGTFKLFLTNIPPATLYLTYSKIFHFSDYYDSFESSNCRRVKKSSLN